MRWLMFAALGAALAMMAARPAWAQDKPDFDAAKRHYMSGKTAQGKGEYERAVSEYIQAYDITKDPSLFKQIAQAYEAAGKKTEAVVYYRRYLSEGKGGADTEDIKAKIATLEGRPVAPPTEPAATQPAVTPEPPPLPPEQAPTVRTPVVEPMPAPPAAMMTEEGTSWQRTTAWVSVGLAAVALTTGSVLLTSASSREDDIQRLIDFRDPVTGLPREYAGTVKSDYEDKVDEGKKLNNYATYAFIGAGVFTASAVLFFVLDATRSVPEARQAHLVPMVGPGTVGLTFGWEL